MTPRIAHVSFANSMAIQLATQAGHAAEAEVSKAMLESAVSWVQHGERLAKPIVKPDCSEKASEKLKQEFAGLGVTWAQTQPVGIFRWTFSCELLDVPPGFEEGVAAANQVELKFTKANGGDGRTADRMIETLKRRGVPVHGHVVGHACSAHADLFVLGCTHRVVSKRAKLMVHSSHCACFATAAGLRRAADDMEEWDRKRLREYAARTGRSIEDVQLWFDGRDYWFPAKRAVAAGLADEVT